MNRSTPALLCLALAPLALAACSSEPEVKAENASFAEVSNRMAETGLAEDARIAPGRWQISSTVSDVKLEGVPEQVAAQVRTAMQQTVKVEYCVTPEEAAKPSGELFTGKTGNNCSYDRFALGDGKINAVLRCADPRGGSVVTRIGGTYSPEAYQVKTAVEARSVAGGKTEVMTLATEAVGTRIGECKAAAAPAGQDTKRVGEGK